MTWIEKTNEYFEDLRLWNLKIDEAFLRINSNEPAFIYELSADCDRCPYTKYVHIKEPGLNATLKVNTAESLSFQVFKSDYGQYVFPNTTDYLCFDKPKMGEFGVYNLKINESGCEWSTALEPVNVYLPILVAIFGIALFTLTYKLLMYGYRKFIVSQNEEMIHGEVKKQRLKSLDTFRGIAIVIMIFANSGCGGYAWIEHAHWDGLHIADLVFPWFLWIMGVCIPMSLRSQLCRTTKWKIFLNVLRRSLTLFAIGFVLNSEWGPAFSEIRTFGVLQRFGVAYFVVSILMMFFMNPEPLIPQTPMKKMFFDIIQLTYQYITVCGLIIVYLFILFFLPVPGCTSGYLGPAGKHNYFENPECPGGATGYIDRLVLGEKHIYQWPTTKKIYESGSFDPEGLLGCIPTVFQVLLGVQAGMILLHHPDNFSRIKRWLIWGVVLCFLSGTFCGFSLHGGIPINKNLWSISFVLITAGLANILLSLCYYLIDVSQVWKDSYNPFLYPGMNSIILYVGHTIIRTYPFRWRFDTMNTHFLRFSENIWNTMMWVMAAIYLYEKKVFYSI